MENTTTHWKTLRRIVNTNIRCNMYEKLMQSL